MIELHNMNLQLNYLCTYKLITEDNEDEIGLRDILYKIQLLQLFNMNEFNEDILNNKIDYLFNSLKNEEFINKIINNHSYYGNLDENLIFRTLFSYDYLDLFQKCLYNIISGFISNENKEYYKLH